MPILLLNVAFLVLAILLLWKGSDWLVDSAARIGRRFNISDLTIGLTIVAFGTSAPEFAVTISAAIEGRADVSVGNIVGSNIFNLGFILGGCALFQVLKTNRTLVYRDGSILVATAAFLVFVLWDGFLARWEGLALMAGLVVYLIVLFVDKTPLDSEVPEGVADWKDFPRLLLGLLVIVGGGYLLVESASEIARALGISEWVISVTIVAAGTSAPEFATSLMAAYRGRHAMSLGNLVGSDLFNLLGVLGLAGIIRPMGVDPASFSSVLMLLGMCMVVVLFMRTGWRINRLEAAILVGIGLFRWGMDFWIHPVG